MPELLSARAAALLLPTNPHVSPDVDPTQVAGGSFEYANPVALNNRVVFYTNAMFEAADELTALMQRLRSAKLAKRKAERALEQFEQRVLRLHPAPKGASSLKALAAHIQKAAYEQDDTGTQLDELRVEFERAEDAAAALDSQISQLRVWMDAIEAAQGAIQTHLSFVKSDIHHGRRGGHGA